MPICYFTESLNNVNAYAKSYYGLNPKGDQRELSIMGTGEKLPYRECGQCQALHWCRYCRLKR